MITILMPRESQISMRIIQEKPENWTLGNS